MASNDLLLDRAQIACSALLAAAMLFGLLSATASAVDIYIDGTHETIIGSGDGASGTLVSGQSVEVLRVDANGSLTISEGGQLSVGRFSFLGKEAGMGTLTLTGAGSQLYMAPRDGVVDVDLLVGYIRGNGTLEILDGAAADIADRVLIGFRKDATATVSGAGSKMVSRYVGIGSTANGTLIVTNGGFVQTRTNSVTLGDRAGARGTLVVSGAGSQIVSGRRLYVGYYGAGVFTLQDGGVAEVADSLIIGVNAGSTGTLNIGAASGEAAIAAGIVQGSNGAPVELLFGLGDSTLVLNHTETDYTLNATASGDGLIAQQAGFTRLTGDFSAFTGLADITGGAMAIDTNFGGAVHARSGTTISGNGTVGDVSFDAGATYQVHLTDGAFLGSTGTATIDSGASVHALTDSNVFIPLGTTYTILSADEGVSGQFGSAVVDNYDFLDIFLSADPNNVYLTLGRNSLAFEDVALTPNQRAAGTGTDSLDQGVPVFEAVVYLDKEQTPAVFDQLSGEIHASVRGTMMSDTILAHDAIDRRLRTVANAPPSSGELQAVSLRGSINEMALETAELGGWSQAYGTFRHTDGDGNAAALERFSGGIFVGADKDLGSASKSDMLEGWRAGFMSGYGRTSAWINDRASLALIDSYTMGIYAAHTKGPWRTRLGATYTAHDIATLRNVGFTGFTDQLAARYNGVTAQAFGEISYRVETRYAALEPFAGVTLVDQHNNTFSERGGSAALNGQASLQRLGSTTLGLRGEHTIVPANSDLSVTLDGSLAWRHAYGDLSPTATMAYVAGGDAFTIAGAPLDANTALVEAGMGFGFSKSTDLALAYSGAFSQGVQDHSMRAALQSQY
jgi:outer membrane autotransporter protein